MKYSYSDREVDRDTARELAATVDTGGVALSPYLVDRTQDKLDLLLTYSFTQSLSASFNLSSIEDDYDAIAWASLDTTDTSIATVDVNYSPNQDYSLNFYAGVESFEVEQSGFGNLSNPTTAWQYSIEDKSDIFGMTVRADDLSGMVDLSVDYRYQNGDGDYETVDPTNVSGTFPNLDTTINRITVNADFFLANNTIINVTYIYEDYDSESWVWKDDFNEPGSTYFGTLNYGYESPTYTTQVFLIGASYQF